MGGGGGLLSNLEGRFHDLIEKLSRCHVCSPKAISTLFLLLDQNKKLAMLRQHFYIYMCECHDTSACFSRGGSKLLSYRRAGNKILQKWDLGAGWCLLSWVDCVSSEMLCVNVHKILFCKPGKSVFSKFLFVVANITRCFPIKQGFWESAQTGPIFD